MDNFSILVNKVEEWQTINDRGSLDEVFQRAKRTLVGGGSVVLLRSQPSGETYPFEEISDLEDFEAYKERVYKYVK